MDISIYPYISQLSTSCSSYCYWLFFFLQPAIGIVLGFIGTKMVFDFFGEQLETTLVHAIVNTFLYTLRFKLCFGFSISNTR